MRNEMDIKRVKGILKRAKMLSYSVGMLVSFLINGSFSYADEIVKSLQTTPTREELNKNIEKELTKTDNLMRKNEEVIANISLKVQSLLKQAAQVVKPWEHSWQFGVNYWWENSKKHGNNEKIYYREDVKDKLSRYLSRDIAVRRNTVLADTNEVLLENSNAYNYGLTRLKKVEEPESELLVTVALKPVDANFDIPGAPPLPTIPNFKPTQILEPSVPNLPVIKEPVIPNFITKVTSNWNGTSNIIDNPNPPNNGVIEMVAITSGDFKVERINPYQYKYEYSNYSGKNTWPNSGTNNATRPAGKTENGIDISSVTVEKGNKWENLSRGSTLTNSGKSIYGFQVLVGGTSASGMLSNANFLYSRKFENENDNLGEFAHLDQHGAQSEKDNKIGFENATDGLSNKDEIMEAYNDAIDNFRWQGRKETNVYVWLNSGNIVAEGGNLSLTNHYDHTGDTSNRTFAINTGNVKFQPLKAEGKEYTKYVSGFVSSKDTSNSGSQHIMFNGKTGKFEDYSQVSAIYVIDAEKVTPLSIVNRGMINLYGEGSAGVYVKRPANVNLQFVSKDFNLTTNSGEYRPLNIFGDKSIGLYVVGGNGTTKGNFAVNVGGLNKGNQVFNTETEETIGEILTNYNVNPSGKNSNIEGTFGIITNEDIELDSHNINIFDKTEDSVGIYVNKTGKIAKLGKGNIKLEGGKRNIGILLNGNGSVESTGNILLKNGENNYAIVAKGNGTSGAIKVTVDKIKGEDIKDSVVIFADNASEVIVNNGFNANIKASENQKSTNLKATSAIFANGANTKVIIDNAELPINSNIVIKGSSLADVSKDVGFAFMVKDGASISAENNNIKVIDGAAGVGALGNNSKINLENSILDYSGRGYAVYVKDGGTVNFDNGKLILRGKATAWDVDKRLSVTPISFSNGKINVMSNDVIVFNILNTGTLNVTTLDTDITSSIGTGIQIIAGTENGITYDNYKLAAVDGAVLNIDAPLNKADKTPNSPSDNYFRKIIGQRLKTTVANNVVAELSTVQAVDFKNQVVAIESNSSSKAVNNNENGLTINSDVEIKSARTDSGEGAIGVFVDYGVVNNQGTILVEKIAKNENGIGIYAVNGSNIVNNGILDVSGNKSTGILALAYRVDDHGNPITNEYGVGALNQGKIYVENNKEIRLDGENTTGIFAKNNNSGVASADQIVKNATNGIITTLGKGSTGIVGKGIEIINDGVIKTVAEDSRGIFAEDSKISNNKEIETGDNGVGIILKDGELTLAAGSKIKVGKESKGVITAGSKATIDNHSTIEMDDSSMAFVFKNQGTNTSHVQFNGENDANILMKNNSTYIYSEDPYGDITNRTALTGNGDNNFGILIKGGKAENYGNIDFTSGTGNVALYSANSATIVNQRGAKISVGKTESVKGDYSIGMATENGTIENLGTIEVSNDGSIGMYASGNNGKAINKGDIKISGKNAIGMYLANNAIGENYGSITTVAGAKKGIKGIVLNDGALIKNYGTIKIEVADGIGIYKGTKDVTAEETGTIVATNGAKDIKERIIPDTSKSVAGILVIKSPNPEEDAKITIDGISVVHKFVDISTPIKNTVVDGKEVLRADIIGNAIENSVNKLDFSELDKLGLLNVPNNGEITKLGMYVDTSGINFTKPIEGIENIAGKKEVNLVFGVEASKYTNSKVIGVEKNILDPYNEVFTNVSSSEDMSFKMGSASLTWIATGVPNANGNDFYKVYLVKVPYTTFVDKNADRGTYNFLDGLEQRYGIEGLGTKEKELFNKLNGIGKGEPILFTQAVNEMKGYQYSNTQRRVLSSHKTYTREFYDLIDWTTETKDTTKVKFFGENSKYRTDKLGVRGYNKEAQGVFVLNNNETVQIGESSGLFFGLANERFNFRDIGKSKERAITGEIGYYKSTPKGYNNEVNWTWKAGLEGSYRHMHRRYLVVDDIYNAKAHYKTYGVFFDNRFTKKYDLTNNLTVEPYAELELSYGRVSKIKERHGEVRLEVTTKDYRHIKPKAGLETIYTYPLQNSTIKTSVDLSIDKELIDNPLNKARVAYTDAGNYNLEKDKKDKVNMSVMGKIGLKKANYGITAKIGYETTGKSIVGGIEFRLKF